VSHRSAGKWKFRLTLSKLNMFQCTLCAKPTSNIDSDFTEQMGHKISEKRSSSIYQQYAEAGP